MAYKKNYKLRKTKKSYTAEERFLYHCKRSRAPGKFNIKFGGAKHSYSDGFREAFGGINNESGTRAEFGNKSGNAYALGHRRGKKAMDEYAKTGKFPHELYYKN